MKKKILVLIGCILFLGGCSMKQKEYTLDEVKEQVIVYLESKYDQKFEYYDAEKLWQSDTITIRVRALDDPLQNIFYTQWKNVDGEVEISDEYPLFLYKYELELYINEKMDNLFKEQFSYVDFYGDIEGFEYNPDRNLEDVLDAYPIHISVTLHVNEDQLEDIELVKSRMQEFHNILKSNCHSDMKLSLVTFICRKDNYFKNKKIINVAKENQLTAEERFENLLNADVIKEIEMSFVNDYEIKVRDRNE